MTHNTNGNSRQFGRHIWPDGQVRQRETDRQTLQLHSHMKRNVSTRRTVVKWNNSPQKTVLLPP